MAVAGEGEDVIVVGAGLMGAASAWSLTRRGRKVLLVEQFGAGHVRGSSHGSARIVRRAYLDPLYTNLTGRAFELWRELESSTGSAILRMLGALDFGPSRAVDLVAANLAECGVPHEVLPAAEAESRWPGMRFDGPVLFHSQGGTMDSARAVEAFVAAARAGGAEVRYGAEVRSIAMSGTDARVEFADGSEQRAAHVVVAAGGWVDRLVGTLVPLPPMRVTQQQIFHFPRLDPTLPPWPSVIHKDAHEVYHLAGGRDGGAGDDRKVGEHDDGSTTTADGRTGVIDSNSRARIVEYVKSWLPGLDPNPRGEASCLYTITPSEDFLLDRVGPLVVCSPCSGHGAKFAPLVGDLVADLVSGGVSRGHIGSISGRVDLPVRFRLAAHATVRSGSVSL